MTVTKGIIVLLVYIELVLGLILLRKILRCPFSYPYFNYNFNISGKRNPHIEDFLDMFLIANGFVKIQAHQRLIEQWKLQSNQKIEQSILKKFRRKQYEQVVNDMEAYRFYFIRSQTRYRQINYVKRAYKIDVTTDCFVYNFEYIKNRYSQLKDIGFECTLRMYNSKNQRKLATRKLREKIMKRDNYTCQLCGKYMPDEIGLQIDHIIPISKGGKTVESNLRVLCSKCNGSKSDKTPNF